MNATMKSEILLVLQSAGITNKEALRNVSRICDRHQAENEKRKFKEHERVYLCSDLKREGFEVPAKTKGTIVAIYRNGEAYAIEFPSIPDGPAVITAYPSEFKALK